VLVVVLLTRSEASLLVGVGVFAVAVATDYLDGYFARRRNQVTKLGILLDPLADKLLTTAAFLAIVDLGDAPAWMVMIILGREFAVTGLRNIAAGRGVIIAASALGKGKMVVQVVAVFLLLLSHRYPLLAPAGHLALWVAVVIALVSALDYFQRFWRDAFRGPTAVSQPPSPSAREESRPLERRKAV
jgi:CDP-diacylglycerol--glycerol-3-phosphate 3-phosphatidyltransferase